MTPTPEPTMPPLPIKGTDLRAKRYRKIAEVHAQIVQTKWQANTAGKPMHPTATLVFHCEEAIAFLAEELLELRAKAEALEPVEEGQFSSDVDLTPINAVKAPGKAEAEG